MSFKVGVQKNLENITRKYLCWSPFFNKVAGLQVVASVLGSEFTKLFQIEISRQIAVNFTLKTNDSFQANVKGNPLNNEKKVASKNSKKTSLLLSRFKPLNIILKCSILDVAAVLDPSLSSLSRQKELSADI